MRELLYVISSCAECPHCTPVFHDGAVICKLMLLKEGKQSWVHDTVINQNDAYFLSRNFPPVTIPERCPLTEHRSLIGEV